MHEPDLVWSNQFVQVDAVLKRRYSRFMSLFIQQYIPDRGLRDSFWHKYVIEIYPTTGLTEGIVGIQTAKIWLQDTTSVPSQTIRISHELCHMLIEFYNKGAEMHRKLHYYHLNNAGENLGDTRLVLSWIAFKSARGKKERVAVIDYAKLLKAPDP